VETYLAPPPPSKGKIIGLDCHPDTFTAAVFAGQTPHDARKIGSRENLSLEALLKWAAAELTPQDIILMEAGSNSFELCKRLGNLGLKACVLESCHVGKHAKTYADNDKMAAANALIKNFADGDTVTWLDIASMFTPEGGNWIGLDKDKLHLSAEGYEIWAAELNPVLDRIAPKVQ
jgi:lysophospholipase L1-like esterase